MISPHPSLAETVQLMRQQMSTDEEWDLLASIEHTVQVHQPCSPEDPDDRFGTCVCCETPWPCRMWNDVFVLAVEWTSRNAGEVCYRSKQTIVELPDPIAPSQRIKGHLKVVK
jgi:hypothetical protein